MFADVSGFTALSEAMSRYGPEGAEKIAANLNKYFGMMVKTIASMGGDVFKVRPCCGSGVRECGPPLLRLHDCQTACCRC